MEKRYIVFDIETTGLNPWYSDKITCICAKDGEANIFSKSLKDCDEKKLIESFIGWLNQDQKKDFIIISCNGKKFDVPFILTRSALLQLPLPLDILKKEHFDLQEITYKPISLNDMAKFFGFELKTGSGLDAIKYYNERDWHSLESYCMHDVKLTEQIYLKHKSLKTK